MTLQRSAPLSALAALILAGACSAEETPMPSQTPKPEPAPAASTPTPTPPPMPMPASGPAAVLSIDDVSGLWSLRPERGEGRCLIALNKIPTGGAYGVHIESCTIAAVAGGMRWRPVAGGFELLGGGARVLMRFHRVDANAFTADGYRLTPAPMA